MDSMDAELGAREYARMFWRRRWVIILVPIITIGLSLAYSLTATKIYEGSASLLLTPQLSSTLLQANNANYPAPTVDVPTDTEIIESHAVSSIVAKTIPNPPSVSVAQQGTTNVVLVTADSPNARLAAVAANAYAKAYISLQENEAVQTLTSASAVVQSHLTAVQNEITSVNAQIANASTNDASSLTTQLESLEATRTALQGDLTNYQFAASVGTGGGQILTAATVPTKPAKPKTIELAILAGILGLALGFALALLLEFLDDGIRTKDDLEHASGGLPVLGLIPEIVDWRDARAQFVVSRSAPKSIPAESYRSLRTAIQFLGLDQSIRTLQFTSPNAAEGKTTTLANLAVVMAQAGKHVVVVCCDFRKPRVHEFFGVPNNIGFTSVLLGDLTLEDALQPVPGIENLKILASGPIPPNPSELLSGVRAGEVLDTLAKYADLVLIDSPPVLPVTDAAVLAGRVDGVVLVAAARSSTRGHVHRALETLGRVDAPVWGVVLNRAAQIDTYSYYHYTYGAQGGASATSRNGTSHLVDAHEVHAD